jgi:hypothetical protein
MRRVLGAAAVCVSLAVFACGSDERPAVVAPVAPIRTANCSDWKRASATQRASLLTNLYAFYSGTIGGSGKTPVGPGPTVSAAQATTVFDNYCAQPYARAFKLYKLYGRAAAFSSGG